MTTHKPGTPEWAEEQARKGAKVRRIEWDDDQWVTLEHNQGRQRFVNSEGNGWLNWAWPDGRWLIVEPAPDDAAEIAAAEDALAEFHAKGGKTLEQLGEEVGLGRMAYGETPPGTTGAKPFIVHEEIAALEKRVAALEAQERLAARVASARDEISQMPEARQRQMREAFARFQPARAFLTGLTAEQLPPGTKTIETEEGILVAETGAEPWKPTPGRDAKTRDGWKVTKLHIVGGWLDGVLNGRVERWYPDGRWQDEYGIHPRDLIADWPDPAPEFKTTRRMSDEEIVRAACHTGTEERRHPAYAAETAIRLTRQRIRADLEANVDAARLTGFRAADEALRTGREDPYDSAIRAALRKHSEVV